MSVIINEFEVISEDTPHAPASDVPGAVGSPQRGPSPRDIAEIIRQQAERRARVEAH